jgi:hypothetical protein
MFERSLQRHSSDAETASQAARAEGIGLPALAPQASHGQRNPTTSEDTQALPSTLDSTASSEDSLAHPFSGLPSVLYTGMRCATAGHSYLGEKVKVAAARAQLTDAQAALSPTT